MKWNSTLILPFLLMAASVALALPEDSKAPVEIESDRADIDQAKDRAVFRGHVQLTQGSFTLWSDKLVVQYRNGKPWDATATGNPAHFRQLPEKDKEWVYGSGLQIHYRFREDDVTLTGNAMLKQKKDTFRSDRILYDRKHDLLKAGASAGGHKRVKVILHPEKVQGENTP